MNGRIMLIFVSAILVLFSMIFFAEYVEIKNIIPDGDGIGISVLGMEINDHVQTENIYKYKVLFIMLGLITLLVSASILYQSKNIKQLRQ